MVSESFPRVADDEGRLAEALQRVAGGTFIKTHRTELPCRSSEDQDRMHLLAAVRSRPALFEVYLASTPSLGSATSPRDLICGCKG